MGKRIQSPTSILTYKQCPRKYFYQYIKKLPTKPSIHLVRGKVAHEVLEDFYDVDITGLTKANFRIPLQQKIGGLFAQAWGNVRDELEKLHLRPEELAHYFEETVIMLMNWFNSFCDRVAQHPSSDFAHIMQELKPLRETSFLSDEHAVRGVVDVIEQQHGEYVIMDYKTSNKDDITDEYKLQLAIYCLLFFEKYRRLPVRAGLFFLKFGPRFLDVNAELVQHAVNEIRYVHSKTHSEDIVHYPQQITPLCKWSSGCCDFYEHCFVKKTDSQAQTGQRPIPAVVSPLIPLQVK